MKIDIIVAYVQRYKKGHEVNFVPPITGIHLAAITPSNFEVRVVHQQVENVNLETDADLIAISFFSGFANEAYALAKEYKKRGKKVVAGGPHVTYCIEEALEHVDSVVVGEAETVWQQMLSDYLAGTPQKVYKGEPCDMVDLPSPRYDLLKGKFFIPKVVQATRGCPFKCSFCSVPDLNPGFRLRPIEDVIKNIAYDDFPYWWQKKVVWFWDDNLTINRKYIKELLKEMIPHKKWWLTQASMDIAKDEELLDLMKASGCIGIFFGIETFGNESLADANKRQNKVEQYKSAVKALHKRGICVMAGFISGFDHDSPESIVDMADRLLEIGVDVPFLSILTPFKGTPLYNTLEKEDRILKERDWKYYNGYNVAFEPQAMSAQELFESHRKLWKKAFSFKHAFTRIFRSIFTLRRGAFYMALFMNIFYFYKRFTNNQPIDAQNLK